MSNWKHDKNTNSFFKLITHAVHYIQKEKELVKFGLNTKPINFPYN